MALTNSLSSVITIVRGLIQDTLKTDGRAIHEYTDDNKFSLKHDYPDSSSIIVLQNSNQLASQDFSYNADTNKVEINFITSGMSLSSGDIIDIRYDYYLKYSDAELKKFLESSLVYFAQHRYKKVFEVNSDEEIISINNVDPTISELNFIAIIASILIDPQNVEINIPDLRLSPRRDKSDQDQIAEAFRSFKRFVGEIQLEHIHPLDKDNKQTG